MSAAFATIASCCNAGLLLFSFSVCSHHDRAAYVCSLRHPNVVFVYGIVVPALENKEGGGNGDSGDAQPGAPIPQGAGMVWPLCLSASWTPQASSLLALEHTVMPLLHHARTSPTTRGRRLLRPSGGVCRQVRPPAIVTEYMSGGSLRSALSRRLEGVQGGLTRLLIALDAAKARPRRPCNNPSAAWQPLHVPGLLTLPGQTPGSCY